MWAITVIKDPATTGVGTIIASWDDGENTFNYSERSELNDAAQIAFLVKANEALKQHLLIKSEEKTISEAISIKANT